MVTKVVGTRIVLAFAAFVCVASMARNANALANNAPYQWDERALTSQHYPGSAAFFNNLYYFAYITPDGNLGILADGQTPVSWNEIAVSSVMSGITYNAGFGTALLSYNGTLYLFYVKTGPLGSITSSYLAMITSVDGANWSPEVFLSWGNSYAFNTPPTAVVWDGQILVYINETNGLLDQFNIAGTSAYGPYQNFNGNSYSTSHRPSATVWQGELVVAFSDAARGSEIGMITYTDARNWSEETLPGLYGIPSVYPLGAGALNMVYVSFSNSHLYSTWSTNGVSFVTPQEDTASTTYFAPVQFTEYSYGQNYVFYIGENSELYTVVEN